MMIPDQKIIIRVKMAAAGFQHSSMLAEKLNTLYRLCGEQLSPQHHYDFGLRNILSILRVLGEARRSVILQSAPTTQGNKLHSRNASSMSSESPRNFSVRYDERLLEMSVLYNCVRDMNISKLVMEDESLFLSLLSDLMPEIEPSSCVEEKLMSAINLTLAEQGLVNSTLWREKLLQLHQIAQVRWGVMLLGHSQTGKTNCFRALIRSLELHNSLHFAQVHKEVRLNPKAMNVNQLYGWLDPQTNDWTDGIFSALWRKISSSQRKEHTWLVLDGPVDPGWIENLNTVLDDNKMLTLTNGDRISMSSNSTIVFEVENISNASPATVSRTGMVYFSVECLGWESIFEAWLKHCVVQGMLLVHADYILMLVSTYLPAILNFVSKECSKSVITLTQISQVTSFLRLFEAVLSYHAQPQVQQVTSDSTLENDQDSWPHKMNLPGVNVPRTRELSMPHISRLFLFSVAWSIGALLNLTDRVRMHNMLVNLPPQSLPPLKYYIVDTDFWTNAFIRKSLYERNHSSLNENRQSVHKKWSIATNSRTKASNLQNFESLEAENFEHIPPIHSENTQSTENVVTPIDWHEGELIDALSMPEVCIVL